MSERPPRRAFRQGQRRWFYTVRIADALAGVAWCWHWHLTRASAEQCADVEMMEWSVATVIPPLRFSRRPPEPVEDEYDDLDEVDEVDEATFDAYWAASTEDEPL